MRVGADTMCERVYYHVVFSVARGKPAFLNEEIDAAFKHLIRDIARRTGWALIEMESIPRMSTCCWRRRPGTTCAPLWGI